MIELSIAKQARTDRLSGDKRGEGYISSRIGIGEKEQAALILYDNGVIRACNQASGDVQPVSWLGNTLPECCHN